MSFQEKTCHEKNHFAVVAPCSSRCGYGGLRIDWPWLPDVSGSHPLYYGDLKQGITLYDRQNMEITLTNVGAGAFENDTTKIRVIDRFDVELIDDGAFAAASLDRKSVV